MKSLFRKNQAIHYYNELLKEHPIANLTGGVDVFQLVPRAIKISNQLLHNPLLEQYIKYVNTAFYLSNMPYY